ncbi:MAG: D-glycerate dehydrogenase, partial [Rhodospirillaceae bacterium]|nr:D-glycerate dehydrogenase [Rhodospirillaceae bacterium]
RPTHMMGAKVTGKTLGLIGFGRIAQAMAHKAHHGFGMKIVFFDPYLADKSSAKAVKAVSRSSVDAVLKEADFVSLHCPSTPETRRLINTTKLKKMKKSAFLINTARGDVVDEKALVKALKSGAIAGAGLDVFEAEPTVTAALLKMENAVLFPHLGSATLETREAMGFRVVDNIKAFFKGRRPKDRVA